MIAMKIESEYYGNWNEDGWWNVVEGISKTSESAPVLRGVVSVLKKK